MKRPKGLPKDLEEEILSAVTPILRKYRDMRKSHLSKDRIAGIGYGAFRTACGVALWDTEIEEN